MTNLRLMVITGPRDPTSPVGPPKEMSRVHGGAGIKYQEFEDGWIYEVYSPVGANSAVPRGKTVKIILLGQWLLAFTEAGINYLSVWLPREEHEALFPNGPPSYREYDENAKEVALYGLRSWADPNETSPSTQKTGEIKLVQLARLAEDQKIPPGS